MRQLWSATRHQDHPRRARWPRSPQQQIKGLPTNFRAQPLEQVRTTFYFPLFFLVKYVVHYLKPPPCRTQRTVMHRFCLDWTNCCASKSIECHFAWSASHVVIKVKWLKIKQVYVTCIEILQNRQQLYKFIWKSARNKTFSVWGYTLDSNWMPEKTKT